MAELAIAADSFPVSIRVDAAKTKGELKPIWRFFGADEPNYAYMKDGQKLIGELGELRPSRSYFRDAQSADLRRRHAGAEVGLDRRLPRRRRAASRSTTGRFSIASSTRTSSAACGRTRRSASCRRTCRSSRSRISTTGRRAPDTTRSTPAGPIRRRITTSGRELVFQWVKHCVEQYGRAEVEIVVLGSLERAEHRLLARHAGGISQAARLRHRRRAPRAADGEGRRPGHRRQRRQLHARLSSSIACAARTTRPARSARRSTSSRFTPRARRPTSTATCGWASPTSCARSTTAFASSPRFRS